MYCTNCGNNIKDDSVFCDNCGERQIPYNEGYTNSTESTENTSNFDDAKIFENPENTDLFDIIDNTEVLENQDVYETQVLDIVHNDEFKNSQEPSEPETRFCGNCGAKLDNDAIFCGNCGSTLNISDTGEISKINIPQKPTKKKGKAKKILVSIAAVLIISILGLTACYGREGISELFSKITGAKDNVGFYLDNGFTLGDLTEKVQNALNDVQNVHVSQDISLKGSVMGMNADTSTKCESDVNIANNIVHNIMTVNTDGSTQTYETYIRTEADTCEVWTIENGVTYYVNNISKKTFDSTENGLCGIDNDIIILSMLDDVSYEKNDDNDHYTIQSTLDIGKVVELTNMLNMSEFMDLFGYSDDSTDSTSETSIGSLLSDVTPMSIKFVVDKNTWLPTQIEIDMTTTIKSMMDKISSINSLYSMGSSMISITEYKCVSSYSKYNELSEIVLPEIPQNAPTAAPATPVPTLIPTPTPMPTPAPTAKKSTNTSASNSASSNNSAKNQTSNNSSSQSSSTSANSSTNNSSSSSNSNTNSSTASNDNVTQRVIVNDVENKVKAIRNRYNVLEAKKDTLTIMSLNNNKNDIDVYYDYDELVEIVVKPDSEFDYYRYYYFDDQKLCFAFIFKGKQENRFYFDDYVLFRWIDESGAVHDNDVNNQQFLNWEKFIFEDLENTQYDF